MTLRPFATFALLVLAAATATPAFADDAKLLEELKELRARLEAVEKELAESKKAKEAPPADPAKKDRKPRLRGLESAFEAQGYIESRFTNYANSRGDERTAGPDFQLSRLRMRLNFAPAEHWLTSLEINAGTRSDATTAVDMREFYFQYLNNNRVVRVGQQRIPFGFQVGAESSVNRAALERARHYTQLFPNERDIGIVYGWNNHINNPNYDPKKPRYTLGVMNGEGINKFDQNQDKSFAGNVSVPIGRHNVGASFYTGSSTQNAYGTAQKDISKHALGIEHRFDYLRFHTQFEAAMGELFGDHFTGGFGQLLYDTGRTGNFFVRGDVFDPDTSAGDDYWRRVSLGWYKDINKHFRLTGQYDFLHAGGFGYDNTWGIEAQLRF